MSGSPDAILDRPVATWSDGKLEADVLREIICASNNACWCMEFGTPVDLTAPDHEVVRQVFENDPFWRFANPAMSDLYLFETGVDLTSRPTAEIFPRNAQNEAFVRTLIENGFEMDAAPALDTRYDGEQIFVENDVRAHISGGRLLRMFGIVRDVGKHRIREQRIRGELNEALNILTALPTGVIAFDADGEACAANPAAGRLLGLAIDDILGGALSDRAGTAALVAAARRAATSALAETVQLGAIRAILAPRPDGGAVASLLLLPQGDPRP